MISLPPNPRYERKFVTRELSVQEVLALVRRHPAAFREVYPVRSVNNLYLDSADLRDYHDHVNGIAHRAKTRIRWYGAMSHAILSPTLEHKVKRGQVSGKVSRLLPSLSMNGSVSATDLAAAFDGANLPPLERMALYHLEPSLLNRYRRHYFQSADHRFRLTVDSDLKGTFLRGPGMRVSLPAASSLVVVELKYGLADADTAGSISNAMPMRLTRCSKYVLGIGGQSRTT